MIDHDLNCLASLICLIANTYYSKSLAVYDAGVSMAAAYMKPLALVAAEADCEIYCFLLCPSAASSKILLS